jgi:hypothetical protein
VAERGRQVGLELGEKPALVIRETVERVLAGLEQIPNNAILGVPVGGMRLIDYLPTRAFELTIHTLDIAAAIGKEVEPPPAAMEMTLYCWRAGRCGWARGQFSPWPLPGVGHCPRALPCSVEHQEGAAHLMAQQQIQMYGAPWCPDCKRSK